MENGKYYISKLKISFPLSQWGEFNLWNPLATPLRVTLYGRVWQVSQVSRWPDMLAKVGADARTCILLLIEHTQCHRQSWFTHRSCSQAKSHQNILSDWFPTLCHHKSKYLFLTNGRMSLVCAILENREDKCFIPVKCFQCNGSEVNGN